MRLTEVDDDWRSKRVFDIELKKLEGADEDILEHALKTGGIVFYDDVAVKQLLETTFLDEAFKKVEASKEYNRLTKDGHFPSGWHKYRYSALFFRPQVHEHAFGGALYATLTYSIVLKHKDIANKKVYPRAVSTLRNHLGDVTQSTVKYDPAKDIDLSKIFHEYFTEIRYDSTL